MGELTCSLGLIQGVRHSSGKSALQTQRPEFDPYKSQDGRLEPI